LGKRRKGDPLQETLEGQPSVIESRKKKGGGRKERTKTSSWQKQFLKVKERREKK